MIFFYLEMSMASSFILEFKADLMPKIRRHDRHKGCLACRLTDINTFIGNAGFD